MGDGNRIAGFGLCHLYTAGTRSVLQYIGYTLSLHASNPSNNLTHKKVYGDKTTDELFTTVCLSPCLTHQIDIADHSPHGFFGLSKLLEPSNLTEMRFPAAMINIRPTHSDTLRLSDVGRKEWKMKLVFDVETGEYTAGEEWASFARAKALREGDAVVFVTGVGLPFTLFATSQAHSQSGTRHSINLDAFSKAIGGLMQLKPVELTYSPLDAGSDFLVSPKVYRESLLVDWKCGMRVKKVREYDGENHVGTITSTTFGNTDVHGVMRSLWRCHSVVWDAPHGFDRAHFSPWEVTPTQEQPLRLTQPPHTLQLFP
ncbi:B3 DNA binding domain-containing protein [Hirschfeldia incana]|nr:B3 DNA binding domain-containing protein [Hirschfeldia incana]